MEGRGGAKAEKLGWGCGAMHFALGSNSKAMKRTCFFFPLLGIRVNIPPLCHSDAVYLHQGDGISLQKNWTQIKLPGEQNNIFPPDGSIKSINPD